MDKLMQQTKFLFSKKKLVVEEEVEDFVDLGNNIEAYTIEL